MTTTTEPVAPVTGPIAVPISKRPWRRLFLGQTAIDFWGRRRLWMGI